MVIARNASDISQKDKLQSLIRQKNHSFRFNTVVNGSNVQLIHLRRSNYTVNHLKPKLIMYLIILTTLSLVIVLLY